MDTEERVGIVQGIGEEIITADELREVFETTKNPVAYDGFEPSGLATMPFGVFRPLVFKELMKTGIKFIFFLADWHAWINNKMGGDIEKIRKVGEYFIEVWRAAGIEKNAQFVWASDIMDQEYWKKVVLIAKNTSVKRATRALTIMGRKEGEMIEVAQYFYPMMQTADIFQLDVDITQLGLDQRRANILAREVAPQLGWKKPVVISHHMLMGLQGVKEPEGFDIEKKKDIQIASKMSKSRPQTAIFVHDSKEEIGKKIGKAFCEQKNIENNPILDYTKHIIFRAFDSFTIQREQKFGGEVTFENYEDLELAFWKGKLHPQDLKPAVAEKLDELVAPIRTHFETNKRAKELYEFVKKQDVTR